MTIKRKGNIQCLSD